MRSIKIKKTICVVLLSTLIVTAFCACGEPSTDSSDVGSLSGGSNVSQTDTNVEEAKYALPYALYGYKEEVGVTSRVLLEGYEKTDYGFKFKLSARDVEIPSQCFIKLKGKSIGGTYLDDFTTYDCYLSKKDNLKESEFKKLSDTVKCGFGSDNQGETVYAYAYMPDIDESAVPLIQFYILEDEDKHLGGFLWDEFSLIPNDTVENATKRGEENKVGRVRHDQTVDQYIYKGTDIFLANAGNLEIAGTVQRLKATSKDSLELVIGDVRCTPYAKGTSIWSEAKKSFYLDAKKDKKVKAYAIKNGEIVAALNCEAKCSDEKITKDSSATLTFKISGYDITKFDKVALTFYANPYGYGSEKIHNDDTKYELEIYSDDNWQTSIE